MVRLEVSSLGEQPFSANNFTLFAAPTATSAVAFARFFHDSFAASFTISAIYKAAAAEKRLIHQLESVNQGESMTVAQQIGEQKVHLRSQIRILDQRLRQIPLRG